jgi:cupin 2 domain-containing protein
VAPARALVDNLFAHVPTHLPDELVEVLVQTDRLRLERIVSLGHATPAGQWLDQRRDEWVVLVRGNARVTFEGEAPIEMRSGDHLMIRAGRRHRVEWTDPSDVTVWLALYY